MSKGQPPQYELPTISVEQSYQPVAQTVKSQDATVVSTQPGPPATVADVKPGDYLGLSLFTCLCCCWVLGIIALIMSFQVNSAWANGDLEGARRASTRAKMLSIAGIICGSIIAGVVVLIQVIATVVWAATHDHDDDHDINRDDH